MDYLLETKNLCKSYHGKLVLNNISMTIKKGAIYGFVGKNGAGKTTLIRTISGLINKTSGEYTLNLSPGKGKMAGIIESPSIYLNMSAYNNLKSQCLILGIKDYSRIEEILKQVNLLNTGKKKAKDFSLGMRQRLGIGLCLLGNPEFLVLDEPTNGLDPQGIIEIRELLQKLNREQGITILISSHILSELDKLADCFGFIDNGCLLEEISHDELTKKCQASVVYNLSTLENVKEILEENNIKDYQFLPNNTLQIFEEVNISDLVIKLTTKNIFVLGMHEKNDNLENYFVNLINGVKK